MAYFGSHWSRPNSENPRIWDPRKIWSQSHRRCRPLESRAWICRFVLLDRLDLYYVFVVGIRRISQICRSSLGGGRSRWFRSAPDLTARSPPSPTESPPGGGSNGQSNRANFHASPPTLEKSLYANFAVRRGVYKNSDFLGDSPNRSARFLTHIVFNPYCV